MNISEQQIEDIVRNILQNLPANASNGSGSNGNASGTVFGGALNQAPGAYGGPSARGGGVIDDPQNRPAGAHAQGSPSELMGLHGIFATVDEAVAAAVESQ